MTLLEVLHKPRPRRCKPPLRDAHGQVCWLMEEVVAATFAVPVTELRLPSRRSADVAFARQTAMYLAHVVFGLTHNKVGKAVPPRPHHGAACMHAGRTAARQCGVRPHAAIARRHLR
jgi:hypothetical protein